MNEVLLPIFLCLVFFFSAPSSQLIRTSHKFPIVLSLPLCLISSMLNNAYQHFFFIVRFIRKKAHEASQKKIITAMNELKSSTNGQCATWCVISCYWLKCIGAQRLKNDSTLINRDIKENDDECGHDLKFSTKLNEISTQNIFTMRKKKFNHADVKVFLEELAVRIFL